MALFDGNSLATTTTPTVTNSDESPAQSSSVSATVLVQRSSSQARLSDIPLLVLTIAYENTALLWQKMRRKRV